jgi:hypothetical protein
MNNMTFQSTTPPVAVELFASCHFTALFKTMGAKSIQFVIIITLQTVMAQNFTNESSVCQK